jgi:hypothetical protein
MRVFIAATITQTKTRNQRRHGCRAEVPNRNGTFRPGDDAGDVAGSNVITPIARRP